MSDEMISRSKASSIRLASQATAIVLMAGAVLVAAVGLPFSGGSAPEPVSYETLVESAGEQAAAIRAAREEGKGTTTSLAADVEAIEYSLQMVSNAPKPPEPDAPEQSTEEPNEPEAPAEVAGRTRFLGTVGIGERLMALLSAGGAQRILGPGQSATLALTPGDQGTPPSVEVIRVTADEVWLKENGAERRVEKAQRVGFAISQSAAPVAAPLPSDKVNAAVDAAAAQEGILEADKPINPDDFRRDDGTIDYEALREAARARARARQEARRQRDEENGRN
jgi:hypothetical protein